MRKLLIVLIFFFSYTTYSQTAEELELAKKFFLSGIQQYENKNFHGAIADYTQGIKLRPKNASLYINRGLAKSGLGDNNGAIDDLNKALEIDPRRADANVQRGVVRGVIGDSDGACYDFLVAVSKGSKHGESAYNHFCKDKKNPNF